MTGLQKEQTQPARAGLHVLANEADAVERSSPPVDMEQARRFLQVLDPSNNSFHFRTFPDQGGGAGRNYHGTLDELATDLQLDNGNGRGVFVVVNDGGQRAGDIHRVRAVFADFDKEGALKGLAEDPHALRISDRDPHLIVRSSPGKWHVYWRVHDLPIDEFGAVQKALAARFGSDPSVCDLSRVMRLPGFIHNKRERVRCELERAPANPVALASFSAAEIRAAFPRSNVPEAAALTFANFIPTAAANPDGPRIVEAGRHEDIVALAAQQARKVVFEGLSHEAALALLHAERERGRWTRVVPDVEIADALASAVAKCRAGEWRAAASASSKDILPRLPAAFVSRDRSLNFRSAADLINTPAPMKWLIRRTLEQDSLCQVFGDPGSGKSFLAIDWAASIATGRDWTGRKVAQGAVFYIAGEGGNGIGRRLSAWEIANETSLQNAPLFVSTRPASLTNDEDGLRTALEDVAQLMQRHGAPKLIVLDTVARNFGPGDENKTQDMTAFVAACDMLRTHTGATVLAVHHSGHADKSRGRGSAALKAALDWEYAVAKEHGVVYVLNSKSKECELQQPMAFRLESVDLGTVDDEGEPVHSAVLIPGEPGAPSQKGRLGSGRNQTLAMRVLHAGLRDCADRFAANGTEGEPWVSRADWRDQCEKQGLARKPFTETIKRLSDQDLVHLEGDRVTLSVSYRRARSN